MENPTKKIPFCGVHREEGCLRMVDSLEYTVKHRGSIIQNMYATKRVNVNQLYSTSEPKILNTQAAPPALVHLNINFNFYLTT